MQEQPTADFKVFKYRESVDRLAGEEPLLQNLATIFLEDAEPMADKVSQAISRGDLDSLRFASHSVAGLVGNFGAEDAFSYAKALEKIGKEGQLPNTEVESSCRGLFDSLNSELSDLKVDLRCYLDQQPS